MELVPEVRHIPACVREAPGLRLGELIGQTHIQIVPANGGTKSGHEQDADEAIGGVYGPDANRITIRLMQDMTGPFDALRANYEPKMDRLGIDFGLATLIATSSGTMFGRGLISDLTRIDKQIVGIARHRQRSGGKPRDSLRYRRIVTRLRGMLKTRINATLNRIVALHEPAALEVERLDFRLPALSRRMNRLVTNCGRAVFRAKLADLEDKFGITATEVPSPYTSQECSLCHYVDARNRRSQKKSLAVGAATRFTPMLTPPEPSPRDVLWDWARSGLARRQSLACWFLSTPRDFHGRWERPPTPGWTIRTSAFGLVGRGCLKHKR
jgi:hypothetical protein